MKYFLCLQTRMKHMMNSDCEIQAALFTELLDMSQLSEYFNVLITKTGIAYLGINDGSIHSRENV